MEESGRLGTSFQNPPRQLPQNELSQTVECCTRETHQTPSAWAFSRGHPAPDSRREVGAQQNPHCLPTVYTQGAPPIGVVGTWGTSLASMPF